MKKENRNKGRRGEEVAAQVLIEKGYEVIERNFSNKFGEVDIIARDGEVLVFVEVKAKTGDQMGNPEEMVGKGKLARIRNMANLYLENRKLLCRIDVVAIVFSDSGGVVRLTHYENVY